MSDVDTDGRLEWAIGYSDRSIFTNSDGSWGKAPYWDAQIVVTENETVGRQFHCRNDFFILEDGEVMCIDIVTLVYLLEKRGFAKLVDLEHPTQFELSDGTKVSEFGLKMAAAHAGIIKLGIMLPTPKFRALIADAYAMEGFPRKSGWLPDEPRLRPVQQ
jgi:hypothetical protein